jgi:hypothetical protein
VGRDGVNERADRVDRVLVEVQTAEQPRLALSGRVDEGGAESAQPCWACR